MLFDIRKIQPSLDGLDLSPLGLTAQVEDPYLVLDLLSPHGEVFARELADSYQLKLLVELFAKSPLLIADFLVSRAVEALLNKLLHDPASNLMLKVLTDVGQKLIVSLAETTEIVELTLHVNWNTARDPSGGPFDSLVRVLASSHYVDRFFPTGFETKYADLGFNQQDGHVISRLTSDRSLAGIARSRGIAQDAVAPYAAFLVASWLGVAAAALVLAGLLAKVDDTSISHEVDNEPRSVRDVVLSHDFVDQLDQIAGAQLRTQLEPFLGAVQYMIQDGRFSKQKNLESQIESAHEYLFAQLRGDRDGNLNMAVIYSVSQQLISDVAPYFPQDKPGAELGTALAHQPDDVPDFNTAISDAETIATNLDESRLDLPPGMTRYEWLIAHLSWGRAARAGFGALGGGLAVAGIDSSSGALGVTADVSGILQALGVHGPWAVLIGATVGLLGAGWKPPPTSG